MNRKGRATEPAAHPEQCIGRRGEKTRLLLHEQIREDRGVPPDALRGGSRALLEHHVVGTLEPAHATAGDQRLVDGAEPALERRPHPRAERTLLDALYLAVTGIGRTGGKQRHRQSGCTGIIS